MAESQPSWLTSGEQSACASRELWEGEFILLLAGKQRTWVRWEPQEINLFGLCQTQEEEKQSLQHGAFSWDSLTESSISWIHPLFWAHRKKHGCDMHYWSQSPFLEMHFWFGNWTEGNSESDPWIVHVLCQKGGMTPSLQTSSWEGGKGKQRDHRKRFWYKHHKSQLIIKSYQKDCENEEPYIKEMSSADG